MSQLELLNILTESDSPMTAKSLMSITGLSDGTVYANLSKLHRDNQIVKIYRKPGVLYAVEKHVSNRADLKRITHKIYEVKT